MEGKPCPHASQLYRGHTPWRLADLIFCIRCGYYAQIAAMRLTTSCPMAPLPSKAWRLSGLMAGIHPRTGKYVAEPEPVLPSHDIVDLDGCVGVFRRERAR